MHRAPFSPSKPALVIGASGLVGHLLWRALPQDARYGTFHTYPEPDLIGLDIRDAGATVAVIDRISPAVIFHPAAIPNADTCAMDPDTCAAVNISGTTHIVDAARRVGAAVVFFSTDYVFDGIKGAYTEHDPPSPINLYGETKLAGETVVATLEDHLIIRLTGVYGWERRGKNFVMGLIARLGRGERMRVPADQIGSPTYAENMIAAVLELVASGRRGLYHVAGSEALDRYTFACMAAETFGLDRSLLDPVRTDELGQKALRPLNAGLRIEKVQAVLATRLMGPREGLLTMRQQGNPFQVKVIDEPAPLASRPSL